MSGKAGSADRGTALSDGRSGEAQRVTAAETSPTARPDVLSLGQFLKQLDREKRRSDRSRAPLSLVVIELPTNAGLDSADFLDIVMEVSLRKRETDFVGYVEDGVIAFLLPYAGAEAAKAFSDMIVGRVGVPSVVVNHATYPDQRFDGLAQRSLVAKSPQTSISTHIRYPAGKPRWQLAMKRALDVVGALSLLLIASPLLLVTAAAVKLTSPGPVIFRQIRIGRDGVPFEFYKFRSMRADTDETVHREYVAKLIDGRHQEVNEGDSGNPVYKLKSDSRITRVGRIIRKTSIDELPQLINVLKGDMSLVGPRPPISYETERYLSWHIRRLQEVRPGITGLWQVEGRSKTTFDDMVRLDLRYIRSWSLWLDIRILLRTIVVVFRGDGAG